MLRAESSTLTLADFVLARARIASHIHQTPVVRSRALGDLTGCEVYLKCEMFQRTGSYEIRGPLNVLSLMTPSMREKGVICASAGNHAQGVALAARVYGIPAVVVTAERATRSKVEATKSYGAEVIHHGEIYDDAYVHSLEIQQQRGLTYIHPFDDLRLVAGQGTWGLELIEDVPDLDAVIVPIGGGGLISGVAMAVKASSPRCRVIGVESSGAPALKLSLQEGECVLLTDVRSVIDRLVVRQVGAINFSIAQRFVDEVVLCSDEEKFGALIWIMQRARLVAIGAAAAPVCALLHGHAPYAKGEKIACVLSDGNRNLGQLCGLRWN
jgi:threonine dehydratase